MTRIYTKTGDAGQTGLFGGGRVSKADLRVEAYGAVDELNSVLGWVAQQQSESLAAQLHGIQSDLFTMGAQLATPQKTRGKKPLVPKIPAQRVTELEQWIDALEAGLPELRNFILPGGAAAGAALHVARTVCRRAERRVVALATHESIDKSAVVYLNRLSDLLFVLARSVNHEAGAAERAWHPPART